VLQDQNWDHPNKIINIIFCSIISSDISARELSPANPTCGIYTIMSLANEVVITVDVATIQLTGTIKIFSFYPFSFYFFSIFLH
jgi:hypothetical protein